jgi:DNA polymerase-3 subunit gamma/tau
LEEPPSHVVFMLATTAPEDIPQTIRSRCQHFSFRAVKFEEIVGQLKDLVGREKLEADDDALALLAEAGDGSVRDALSILDQAIASSAGRLTADSVRQLVGTVSSVVLEDVMQAVAQGSSEDVLKLVDRLLTDGQNPTHFAKQMVRFLRNAVVAKVAGSESSLLQISGDERQRVATVAELFSEEDLTRHLQIMLRTHAELGYRQEQRFHLELGLLKMAHAQRLLPIEQLLSEAGVAPSAPRPPGKPTMVPDARRVEPPTARSNYVSPFAADSARKGTSNTQLSAEATPSSGPRMVSAPSTPVVMGSAAPAAVPEQAQSLPAPAPVEEKLPKAMPQLDDLRNVVLNALAETGQRMLIAMLEAGEWKVEGNDLVIKVASSAAVIDMSFGADARRVAIATASGILGRPVKVKVVSGGTPQAVVSRPASNGGGRTRAEQDPIVQRIKEKFGAEIRTIIDYQERK